MKKIILVSLIMIVVSSCSIQKRQYTGGYYIAWKQAKNNSEKNETVKNNSKENPLIEDSISKIQDKTLSASLDNSIVIAPTNLSLGTEKLNIKNYNKVTPNRTSTIILSKNKPTNPNSSANTQQPEQSRRLSAMALVGFILSIIGIPLCIIGIGAFFGLLAIVFSAIGLGQCGKHHDKFWGNGFAIAGLILGILVLLAGGIVLLLIALALI